MEQKLAPTFESLYQYQAPEWFRDVKFGYKDICALWKAEKFDPEEPMALYYRAIEAFEVLANNKGDLAKLLIRIGD